MAPPTSPPGTSDRASAAWVWRLIRTWANGCPAFAQYRVDPAGGHTPWTLQILELRGDRVAGIHVLLDTEEVFARFGVPGHLPAS